MGIIELIRISFKAILINKMRAFLTMLGIIIGVSSVIIMLAIGESAKLNITSYISDMGSNLIAVTPKSTIQSGVRPDATSMQTLTMQDYIALETETDLMNHVSPMVTGAGQVIYGSKNWKTTMYGISTNYLDIRILKIRQGTMFSDFDVRTSAKVAILGSTVVKNLFPEEKNPIGQMVRFNNTPFKIVGILDAKGSNTFGQDQDDLILAPYSTVQKRILGITYFHHFMGSAISEEKAEEAVAEVTEILADNHKIRKGEEYDFEVSSQKELIDTFSSITDMLTLLLVTIAAISLIVGGIGIMNIMYVSVKERTKEIGLRLAVGARAIDILKQFLYESLIISFTGGFIGITIGLTLTFAIGLVLDWQIVVPLVSIVIAFSVCTATGIFFGWYPAKKASELDPIQALRYE